jgi:hypothetical protein
VNDPPKITANETTLWYYDQQTTCVNDIQVSDDAHADQVIEVTLTAWSKPTRFNNFYLVDSSSLSYYYNYSYATGSTLNQTYVTVMRGSVSAINSALSRGVCWVGTFVANDDSANATSPPGQLTIFANDLGNPTGGANLTASYTIFTKSYNNPSSSLDPSAAGSTTGAFIGLSSLLSGSVYGTYRLLKKKKLLPEDADPWENDDVFDATAENPIYAGGAANAIYGDDE